MKAAPFDYHRPTDLGAALALLADLDRARPLAGGQSLLPRLHRRVVTARHLIDLDAIEDLHDLRQGDGVVEIGAMVTQEEVERSVVVADGLPMLSAAVRSVANPGVRARGTFVGSLVQGDPWAELPLVALVHSGSVQVRSVVGERDVPLETFVTSDPGTRLDDDELVCSVRLRVWPPDHRWAFHTTSARDAGLATVSVGLAGPGPEADGSLVAAAGGVNLRPTRLAEAERWLGEGHDHLGALCDVAPELTVLSEFERHLVAVLLARAAQDADRRVGRPGGSAWWTSD